MIVSLVIIQANCLLLFYVIDHFCLFVNRTDLKQSQNKKTSNVILFNDLIDSQTEAEVCWFFERQV